MGRQRRRERWAWWVGHLSPDFEFPRLRQERRIARLPACALLFRLSLLEERQGILRDRVGLCQKSRARLGQDLRPCECRYFLCDVRISD